MTNKKGDEFIKTHRLHIENIFKIDKISWPLFPFAQLLCWLQPVSDGSPLF